MTPPIIIKKKKVGHGGHHGGAWKVAYADFVTAMMALFIVLWLMNTNQQVQNAIASYFKDPDKYAKHAAAPKSGDNRFALGKVPSPQLARLKLQIEEAIRHVKGFDPTKQRVEFTLTAEGLRMEMIDENGAFFQVGSAEPTQICRDVLAVVAEQLRAVPNRLTIEGHTDSLAYASDATYSNWELSSDRANAARRLLRSGGVRQEQIADVRGYADQHLKRPEAPQDPVNRRVSIVVKPENAKPENTPGEHTISAAQPN